MSDRSFRRQFHLSKSTVRWLCDTLRNDENLRRRRETSTTLTVDLQVLCALRFFGTGRFQAKVASSDHLNVTQPTVSKAIRSVAEAIVRRLGFRDRWIDFPRTAESKEAVKAGFRCQDGGLTGIVGCLDGIHIAILSPKETDTVIKSTYCYCRRERRYGLNVMLVSPRTDHIPICL